MPIYKDIVVEIPDGAYVRNDGSVFMKDRNEYDPEKQYNRVKHTVIGRSIGEGQMHPNHNFRLRYPARFEAASGGRFPRQTKRMGLYAVVLSLVEKNGLYEALAESYGMETADLILDLSMYAVLHRSWDLEQFPSRMEDQLLFSANPPEPAELPGLVTREVTAERSARFMKRWAGKCGERKTREVWIVLDGFQVRQSDRAPSHPGGHAVSFLYAVDSETGDPVALSIRRDGRADCTAAAEMAGWLRALDIRTRGVILDGGLAAEDVLDRFERSGMEYVAALKEDTCACGFMVANYGEKIRMRYETMVGRYDPENLRELSENAEIFYGTESPGKIGIFSPDGYAAHVSLICDCAGMDRQERWFQEVSRAAAGLQRELDRGENASVPEEFQDCMAIARSAGKSTVRVDNKKVQETGDRKGFTCLASSLSLTAGEAHEIYALRDGSAELFSLLKDQAGAGTAKPHDTGELEAQLTLAFAAAVVKHAIGQICHRMGLSTDGTIQEMNGICMSLNGGGEYFALHMESREQLEFMKACGVLAGDLDRIAEEENRRMAPDQPDPFHQFPVHAEEAGVTHRGPGRPKGSKNRKTRQA